MNLVTLFFFESSALIQTIQTLSLLYLSFFFLNRGFTTYQTSQMFRTSQKRSTVRMVALVPLEIFMAREFGMGFFGGGGCLKPLGFFWILIFAPIRSSLSLEIWSTPPPGHEGVLLRELAL